MSKVKKQSKTGLGYEITQKGKQPLKDTRKNIPINYQYKKSLNKNIFLFLGMIAFSFFLGKFYGNQKPVNQIVKMEVPQEFYSEIEQRMNNRLEKKLDQTIGNIDRKIASIQLEQKEQLTERGPKVIKDNVNEELAYFDRLNNHKKEALESQYKVIDFDKYISELNGVHKSYSHYLAEKSRIYRLFRDDLHHNKEVFIAAHDFTGKDRAKYNNFLHKQDMIRAEFNALLKKHNDRYREYNRTRRNSERLVYR